MLFVSYSKMRFMLSKLATSLVILKIILTNEVAKLESNQFIAKRTLIAGQSSF